VPSSRFEGPTVRLWGLWFLCAGSRLCFQHRHDDGLVKVAGRTRVCTILTGSTYLYQLFNWRGSDKNASLKLWVRVSSIWAFIPSSHLQQCQSGNVRYMHNVDLKLRRFCRSKYNSPDPMVFAHHKGHVLPAPKIS
jgi:hypothetical protein